jgi:hypothetical protein
MFAKFGHKLRVQALLTHSEASTVEQFHNMLWITKWGDSEI